MTDALPIAFRRPLVRLFEEAAWYWLGEDDAPMKVSKKIVRAIERTHRPKPAQVGKTVLVKRMKGKKKP